MAMHHSGSRGKTGNGSSNTYSYNNRQGNENGNGNGNGGGDAFAWRRATAKEQLFEILHVAFKRWRLIAGLFFAVALPGILATLSKGPHYEAKGKVLIVSDRADLTIQPTDVNSLATVKLNEAIVNSEVHIIRSRELMEQVVRGLTLAQTSGGVIGIANAANAHEAIGERALRIARRLRVTPVRNSNVIEIAYESGDPPAAAQVVNRVIDEYLAYHAMVHSQKGLPGFYEEQGRLLLQNLRRAEEALQEFAYREGIVSPVAEIQSAVQSIAELEGALRSRNATIAGEEEKIRSIRAQLVEQPPIMKRTQFMEVNPVVRQLKEHLVDRQVDRIALLRKYTDQDRHVRDNAEEIAELRSRLDEATRQEPTVITQEVFAANPVYETRLNKLLELEAKLKENHARKLSLEDELERARRRLVQLKQRALEFDRLEQEVKRQRAAVELYEKREQEARIGEAMNQEKLVNVQVVQRPGLPLEPAGSRRGPLMLALVSGLAVSLSAAFGLEYVNRTLRFERDVERHLGLPVLGAVGEVKQS